jgi:hypothetical protein
VGINAINNVEEEEEEEEEHEVACKMNGPSFLLF